MDIKSRKWSDEEWFYIDRYVDLLQSRKEISLRSVMTWRVVYIASELVDSLGKKISMDVVFLLWCR